MRSRRGLFHASPLSAELRIHPPELVQELSKVPEHPRGTRKALLLYWLERGWVTCSVNHCFKLLRQFQDVGRVR